MRPKLGCMYTVYGWRKRRIIHDGCMLLCEQIEIAEMAGWLCYQMIGRV